DGVWHMPMGEGFEELIKTPFADVANMSSPPGGGACTAATFLGHFAPEGAWAHLDVAGTAHASGAKRRGTGRPLPLLLEYLIGLAA
ncbi:MAG: leucyl aminopeptidase, partial [Duodenibacillus sp.]|nr:leucyl aminopeptidase [Duodenibacillus sp.]